MNISCTLGRHTPRAKPIWNDGQYFSRCSSCEKDLIGRFGVWKAVPKGYRVVWKKRPADYPNWNAAAHASARAGYPSQL